MVRQYRYMARWFVIDFVSCLPFTYIALICGGDSGIGNVKVNIRPDRTADAMLLAMLMAMLMAMQRLAGSLGADDDGLLGTGRQNAASDEADQAAPAEAARPADQGR